MITDLRLDLCLQADIMQMACEVPALAACCLADPGMRLKGHLGMHMRASATSLTPKLMHMPHDSRSAQSIVIIVDAAEIAASASSSNT